jgi:hypothetical protein
VSKENIVIADQAIKMLSNLLCDSNLEVQNNLLELMKENRDIFQFFSYVKDRLEKAEEYESLLALSDSLSNTFYNVLDESGWSTSSFDC